MRGRGLILGAMFGLLLFAAAPSGQQPASPGPSSVDGEILVRFRSDTPAARRDSRLTAVGGRRIRRFEAIDLDHVRIPGGRGVDEAISALRASGDVVSAQPNFVRHITAAPPPNDFFWVNDTAYGFYGLKKIRADQVWAAYTTGSSAVVIAGIDTGVKYTHPDLAANMWTNPGEIAGNGVDDDANGYIDDVYGIDTFNHDSNPMDDHGHGTHTAGTFGAVGNNGPGFATGTGLVGVNWTVKILACKFLNAAGNGTDAGAIECFNYITALRNRGVNIRVSSNSWGGERDLLAPFPQVMKDAIDAAGTAGIINVFAAGNGGADGVGDNIDTVPFDPASFTSPSIVSVAASDANDNRAGFSNYGATSVDLAAPGVGILSTWNGGNYTCYGNPCGYQYSNGTSMAAPHVAGAAALLIAQQPALPVSGVKSVLLSGAAPVPAWSGIVATGGRLDVFAAANLVAANTPPSVTITSPAPGATFMAPASITITANATDATGTVAKVEFFAGATPLGIDTTSPFSIISSGMPAGSYALTAKATDDLGAVSTSAAVPITVYPTSTPSIILSGSSLTFVKQLVGTTSAVSQSVSITNNGPGPLVFGSFNGAPPSSSFSVGGGDFQVQTDCSLTPAGLAPGAFCTFTFRFSPTAAGPRAATLSIGTNAAGAPHAIGLSGTAFVVDEPTVSQTIASGGARQQALQNADGGWYFEVTDTHCGLGPGVSCGNIIGVTALSLLSTYERNGDAATLTAAVAAGNRLIAEFNSAPALPPYSQDLEFLVALSEATADPQYAALAATWFQNIPAAFPNAADRVDWSFTRRDGQRIRSLAVWDLASLIRTAKAVGQADYALAAAVRIRDREADWKDVDPAHRWDQCELAAGCGPADNPRAFDYTLIGMGSLLWAMHDLPGFDAQISDYRAHLLAQQDAEGSWDAGNLQITSYVVMGLGAVGGAGTAIQSAVAYFIANQLPSNGFPFTVTGGVAGGEYTTVNAEVVRAVATLFSTPAGSSVQVAPAQLSRVTFSRVKAPGATTVVARRNAAPAQLPKRFTLVSGLSYQVSTSATVSGHITVCLAVPWAATTGARADVRLLHLESGRYVDRTIGKSPSAAESTSPQVCARVKSLDGFAVALRKDRP
ncbi:MAG: S8 family serine peptidase [Vicinamibacterales bacterium]|jgi:subtilisin family serine protease